MITGVRRGEVMDLKWDAVDWKNNKIHIYRNLLYRADVGIYEDTTKTEESERYIVLPQETMDILSDYRKWYMQQMKNYGSKWHNTNYLFFQEISGNEGLP